MGQHSDAAGISNPGDGVSRLGQLTRHIGRAPVCQVPVKGVFGGGDILFVHQEAGNVRSSDRVRAGQSPHLFIGYFQPQ